MGIPNAEHAQWLDLDDFGFLDTTGAQRSADPLVRPELDLHEVGDCREEPGSRAAPDKIEQGGVNMDMDMDMDIGERKGQRKVWNLREQVSLMVDRPDAQTYRGPSGSRAAKGDARGEGQWKAVQGVSRGARQALLAAPPTPNPSQPVSPVSTATNSSSSSPMSYPPTLYGVPGSKPSIPMFELPPPAKSDAADPPLAFQLSASPRPGPGDQHQQTQERHKRIMLGLPTLAVPDFDLVDDVTADEDFQGDVVDSCPREKQALTLVVSSDLSPPSSPSPEVSPTRNLPPLPAKSPGGSWSTNDFSQVWDRIDVDVAVSEALLSIHEVQSVEDERPASEVSSIAEEGQSEDEVMDRTGAVGCAPAVGPLLPHDEWEGALWEMAGDITAFESRLRSYGLPGDTTAGGLASEEPDSRAEDHEKVASYDDRGRADSEEESTPAGRPQMLMDSTADWENQAEAANHLKLLKVGSRSQSAIQESESLPAVRLPLAETNWMVESEKFQWDRIGGSGPIKEAVSRVLWAADRPSDLIRSTWGNIWGGVGRSGEIEEALESETARQESPGKSDEERAAEVVADMPSPSAREGIPRASMQTESEAMKFWQQEKLEPLGESRESQGRGRYRKRALGAKPGAGSSSSEGSPPSQVASPRTGTSSPAFADRGRAGRAGTGLEERAGAQRVARADAVTEGRQEGELREQTTEQRIEQGAEASLRQKDTAAVDEITFSVIGGSAGRREGAAEQVLLELETARSPEHGGTEKVGRIGKLGGQISAATAAWVDRMQSLERPSSPEAQLGAGRAITDVIVVQAEGLGVQPGSGLRAGSEIDPEDAGSAFEIHLSSDYGSNVDSGPESATSSRAPQEPVSWPVPGPNPLSSSEAARWLSGGEQNEELEAVLRSGSPHSSHYSLVRSGSLCSNGSSPKWVLVSRPPDGAPRGDKAASRWLEAEGAALTCSPFPGLSGPRGGGPRGKLLQCFVGSPADGDSDSAPGQVRQTGRKSASWRLMPGGKPKPSSDASRNVARAEQHERLCECGKSGISEPVGNRAASASGGAEATTRASGGGSEPTRSTGAAVPTETSGSGRDQDGDERGGGKSRGWFKVAFRKASRRANSDNDLSATSSEANAMDPAQHSSQPPGRSTSGDFAAGLSNELPGPVDGRRGEKPARVEEEEEVHSRNPELEAVTQPGHDIQWQVLPTHVAVLGKQLASKRDMWVLTGGASSEAVAIANKVLDAISHLAEKPPLLGAAIPHFFPLHRVLVRASGDRRRRNGGSGVRSGESLNAEQGRVRRQDNTQSSSANEEPAEQKAIGCIRGLDEGDKKASPSGSCREHGGGGHGASPRDHAQGNTERQKLARGESPRGEELGNRASPVRQMSPRNGSRAEQIEEEAKRLQELRELARQLEPGVRGWLIRYVEGGLEDSRDNCRGGRMDLQGKLVLLGSLRKVQDWTILCKRWGQRILGPSDVVALNAVHSKIEMFVQGLN